MSRRLFVQACRAFPSRHNHQNEIHRCRCRRHFSSIVSFRPQQEESQKCARRSTTAASSPLTGSHPILTRSPQASVSVSVLVSASGSAVHQPFPLPLSSKSRYSIRAFSRSSSSSSSSSSTSAHSTTTTTTNTPEQTSSSSSSPSPAPLQPQITPHTYPSIKQISQQLSSKSPAPDPQHAHHQPPDPQKKNYLLIDVREPHEYNSGHIPGAVNLPIVSRPDAFSLSREQFEDVFGFDMPDKSGNSLEGREKKEVVFYCKAGIRSAAAARLCQEAGWEHVGEYPGSWADWYEREESGR